MWTDESVVVATVAVRIVVASICTLVTVDFASLSSEDQLPCSRCRMSHGSWDSTPSRRPHLSPQVACCDLECCEREGKLRTGNRARQAETPLQATPLLVTPVFSTLAKSQQSCGAERITLRTTSMPSERTPSTNSWDCESRLIHGPRHPTETTGLLAGMFSDISGGWCSLRVHPPTLAPAIGATTASVQTSCECGPHRRAGLLPCT